MRPSRSARSRKTEKELSDILSLIPPKRKRKLENDFSVSCCCSPSRLLGDTLDSVERLTVESPRPGTLCSAMTRRTREQIDAALADVDADIDALLAASLQTGRILDLLDQGYSQADATKAATSEARARPPLDHDELDRLKKLRDKLRRERDRLKAAEARAR